MKPQSSFSLNTLGLSHRFMAEHIGKGDCCIDATVGKGRDTLFLCGLVGQSGKVIGFDIQPDAVRQTKDLLVANDCVGVAEVYLASHETMGDYAAPGTVDGIMFNLGWLPGGDHSVFSHPENTIRAIESGLTLLKPGGVMSVCIYYGKENGFAERDALLPFFSSLDSHRYTVLTVSFSNRTGEIPVPVFIIKEA